MTPLVLVSSVDPGAPAPESSRPRSLLLARLRRAVEGCEGCGIVDLAAGRMLEVEGAFVEDREFLFSFLATELGASGVARTLESCHSAVFSNAKRAPTIPYWVVEHEGKWLFIARFAGRPMSAIVLLCSREGIFASVLASILSELGRVRGG